MFKTEAFVNVAPERISNDLRIIAQRVSREDIIKGTSQQGSLNLLGGFFNMRQVVIEPNEVAVIIRNGKIEDILSSTKLNGLSGGVVNWLLAKFAGGEDLEMLFVDTSPVNLEIPVGAEGQLAKFGAGGQQAHLTTKDYEAVFGVCNVRFQINPDNAVKMLNVMRGLKELTAGQLAEKLSSEVISTVYTEQVSKYTREELHGNGEVRASIENTMFSEVRQSLAMMGIDLTKVWTQWGKDEFERTMEVQTQARHWASRTDAWKNADQTERMAAMAREHELEQRKNEQKWEDELAESSRQEKRVETEDRNRTTQTKGEVARSGLVADENLRQRTQADKAVTASKRANAEVDQDMEDRELKRLMDAKKQIDDKETSQTKMVQDHQQSQMALQTASMEKLMAQAIEKGLATPENINEYMRQLTLQKMADRESDKVAAVADAEKQRSNLETYKSAEDRERAHQESISKQKANMAQAEKPNVPHTYVQGGAATPVSTRVDIPADEDGRVVCPKCKEPAKDTWKYCPKCQAPLGPEPSEPGTLSP